MTVFAGLDNTDAFRECMLVYVCVFAFVCVCTEVWFSPENKQRTWWHCYLLASPASPSIIYWSSRAESHWQVQLSLKSTSLALFIATHLGAWTLPFVWHTLLLLNSNPLLHCPSQRGFSSSVLFCSSQPSTQSKATSDALVTQCFLRPLQIYRDKNNNMNDVLCKSL